MNSFSIDSLPIFVFEQIAVQKIGALNFVSPSIIEKIETKLLQPWLNNVFADCVFAVAVLRHQQT